MPSLYVQSQVVYAPGPWGANVPVRGATVEIVDVDAPGNDPDVIWSGRTGDDGRFAGHTGEWRDHFSENVLVPDGFMSAHWETVSTPDYSDVLALTAHVVADGQDAWAVFVHLGDEVPTPPLVVPWGPPGATTTFDPLPVIVGEFDPQPIIPLANVNGTMRSTPAAVSDAIRREVGKRVKEIRIELVEPASVQLMRSSGAMDGITAWAGERLGIPQQWRPGTNQWLDDSAEGMAVGCAVVKSGAGLSPLLVAIGVALLYAVSQGYLHITAGSMGKSRRMPGPGVRFTASR